LYGFINVWLINTVINNSNNIWNYVYDEYIDSIIVGKLWQDIKTI
jgi:hypothetical protein